MPRTIPQIRERLIEIANDYGIEELAQLAEETRRRPHVRRARTVQVFTPDMRDRIIEVAREFPDASYQEIAEVVGTNIGRVSETLVGKREG